MSRPHHAAAHRVIAARLRQARLDSGLTQAAVAKRLGRPQSYISKVEAGERRLDVIELAELAAVFGRRVEDFSP